MEDVMVTGRMSAEKKAAGSRVLESAGLNVSQAINLLFDRLADEQNVEFLLQRKPGVNEWESAAKFIDALASPVPVYGRFDNMTRGEIKLDRLRAREVTHI